MDLFAGGAVGTLFTVLYEVVKEVKDKTMMFKSLLGDLKSTLDSLKPLIEDIEKYNYLMDRPKEELENFKEKMKNGAVLVPKCSTVGRWNTYKKYKYAKKLLDLDQCLNRLLTILNVGGVRDGKETLYRVMNIEEKIDKLQIKEEVVLPKQLDIKAWCAVPELPPVTVGLDEPLRDLKKKLLKDDLSMLVLTAHGGSGKTTLATKFCHDKEVKDKFNNNIFFVTISKKPNLDFVEEVYQRLNSEDAGQNPLLLVLDDVWLGSKSLLQKVDELKRPNAKILVTSRSEFPGFGTPYFLESLNDKDSMTLFHHSASLGNRSSSIPEDLLRKIVERCNGFPLAITVTGNSLRGRATEFWRKRLRDWSKSSILDIETELLLRLQSSIDALDEEDAIIKECFMDLGSFPEDQRIPAAAVIDMWAELYELDEDFLSITNLLELTTRSLANLVITRKENMEMVDDYYIEHFVTQHDMLRQLAVYNAKQDPIEQRKKLIVDISEDNEPKWLTEQKSQPIKARLLSISSDGVFSTKWQSIQLPEVEVLVLNIQTKNYALPQFVEKIDKLKVLIVTNYGSLPAELSNFELLGSASNLKRIRLERISIPSITKNPIQFLSLKKISLFMCNIGQALSNCAVKISDAFPNLEEMNIDYCHDLVELPTEVCDLIHLKKLSITNCHNLYALPERIGKLANLQVLRLRSCTDLVKLPGSMKDLKKLNFLDISDCFSIRELPEDIGEISNLRNINMRQCSRLQELPLSVLDLEQFEEVICDEETGSLWEPFLNCLRSTRIMVAKENINLNWLH
ncbi:unnamed protein product [Prunus armeniaca]|uniref:RPW8 domain-containing protein n=1 Tax=Prunus armeniaca TaxID=36596 RepID=A0A6J5VF06_PRUAR|nr:unnamed protein product [Prunus armeniaca]